MDTRARSAVKAVIWSLLGLMIMTIVGFLATGSMAVGGIMAMINTVVGFATYMIYERIWSGIRWGRHV